MSEDVTQVEAEVIDPLAPVNVELDCTAGAVKFNVTALSAHIDSIVAMFDGWTPDPTDSSQIKMAKDNRAWLNSIAKDLDSRRIQVKKAYLAPFEVAESQIKEITSRVKKVSDLLGDSIKQYDDACKAYRLNEIREAYEEYAGLLLDVVPVERLIQGEKWLNKSCTTWKKELQQKLDRLAQDLQSLTKIGLPLDTFEDAKRILFESLDLSIAINEANRIEEQKARIAELEAAMKQQIEPEPEPEFEPMPEPAPVAPTLCQPAKPVDVWEEPEPVQEVHTAPRPASWVVVIPAVTEPWIKQVLERFLDERSIAHEIYKGTIQQAFIAQKMNRSE